MNSISVVSLLAAVIISVHQCLEIETETRVEGGYPTSTHGGAFPNDATPAAVCAPQQDCNSICSSYTGTSVCSPPYTMPGCFCNIPTANCPSTPRSPPCRFSPPDCTKFCMANNYTGSAVCLGPQFEQCTCFCKKAPC